MSFRDVHQFIVGDIKQFALDQPLDVPAVLLEHADFGTHLPVAQIDVIDFLLHALDLDLQILVHRQAALIVKNLVNQEYIDAAQNKEKYSLSKNSLAEYSLSFFVFQAFKKVRPIVAAIIVYKI